MPIEPQQQKCSPDQKLSSENISGNVKWLKNYSLFFWGGGAGGGGQYGKYVGIMTTYPRDTGSREMNPELTM